MTLLMVHEKHTWSRSNGILTCIVVSLYHLKISKVKQSCFSFQCDVQWNRLVHRPCSWALSYNGKSNYFLIALSGCAWQYSPLLSCRPVCNDSSLDLHGWASQHWRTGRVRTLLCPGLDLLCFHLPLSNHLPRPAEEEWVRGYEEWGQD